MKNILWQYNIIQKTKSNILKQYDNIKVSDILSIFKDKVFGKSYLVDTLTKVKNELIKNTHENKILLLITDGKTTDGSILNIIEERKSKTNTYMVVFFNHHMIETYLKNFLLVHLQIYMIMKGIYLKRLHFLIQI